MNDKLTLVSEKRLKELMAANHQLAGDFAKQLDKKEQLEKENLSLKQKLSDYSASSIKRIAELEKRQHEDGIIILHYDDMVKNLKEHITKLEAVVDAVKRDVKEGFYNEHYSKIHKALEQYETWKGGK